jgi:subfamily B ATP-binding cassette protein MsbA
LKNFFKKYLPFYKSYKKEIIFVVIGMLSYAGANGAIAYLVKPVLDEIFVNKDVAMLSVVPFLFVIAYFAKGAGQYIQTYYTAFIGGDIVRKVRDSLLSHILHLDLSFFHRLHSGELISRVTNDINRIQNAVSSQVANVAREALTVVALLSVVIYQSAELAFYGLVVLPLALYPLSLLAQRMKKISFKSQESISDIVTHLSEVFSNIEIIKANTTQKQEIDRFETHNRDFFKWTLKGIATDAAVNPIMETLGAFAAAGVIYIGGQMVIDGEITVGEFFSFMTALFMLYPPIRSISSNINSMQDAVAANERIEQILECKAEVVSKDAIFDESIESVTFDNVSLKYDDKLALKDISFSAKKGQMIALVGDSGGGKSSLVNLIVRFYDPISGEVRFNSSNISNYSLESIRSKIAIVTQRVYIFNDTIAKNVAYGYDVDKARVIEVLKMAHAWEFVSKMDDGIDTILDESGTNLSGGQRQRVAIARALYKNPEILIFDEATSALDNKSEAMINETIKEIRADKIAFVIAHRLSTVEDADKMLLFKDGEIISRGTKEELLADSKEFQDLSRSSL